MLPKPLLALALIAVLSTVHGESAVDHDTNTKTVTTDAEVIQAFDELQSGQTIVFDVDTLRLSRTLVVNNVSNVTFEGKKESSALLCPDNDSAIVIRQSHRISIANLTFEGCSGFSAIVAHGSQETAINDGDVSLLHDYDEIWESSELCSVSIVGCQFQKNDKGEPKRQDTCGMRDKGLGGGAISGCLCALRVRSSTFEQNSAERGGACDVHGATLQIKQSKFTNNAAIEQGGAIYVSDGNTSIKDCEFAKNHGIEGGGLYTSQGSAFLENCTFKHNTATGDTGAVYLLEAVGSLEKCVFENNSAEVDGGALLGFFSSVTCRECTFRGNSATRGGGFVMAIGDATLFDCLLTSNEAKEGSGFIVIQGTANLTNCTVDSNTQRAGAVYGYQSDATITSCNFTNNAATKIEGREYAQDADDSKLELGGAVYMQDTINGLNITNCKFERNSAYRGGAVFGTNVKASIVNCTFQSNEARNQAGAACVYGTSELLDCLFENNRDRKTGGAAAFEGVVTIKRCGFRQNHAKYGGAIVTTIVPQFSLVDSWFRNNTASTGGGAIVTQQTKIFARNCTFEENSAYTTGGAILLQLSNFSASHLNFARNKAISGGAISLKQSSVLHISGSGNVISFNDNAAFSGGGVSCQLCDRVIVEKHATVKFLNNLAINAGGAMFFDGGYGLLNRNANLKFTRNVARLGGAVYFSNSGELQLLWQFWDDGSTTFTHNEALVGGALFMRSMHEPSLETSICRTEFKHNRAVKHIGSSKARKTFREWLESKSNATDLAAALQSEYHEPGRGGAIYVEFLNTRRQSTVQFLIEHVEITQNKAAVGGGVYLNSSYRDTLTFSTQVCKEYVLPVHPCQQLQFVDVSITNNEAQFSGGGLFASAIKNFEYTGKDVEVFKGMHRDSKSLNIKDNSVKNPTMKESIEVATDAYRLHSRSDLDKPLKFIPGQKLGDSTQRGNESSDCFPFKCIQIDVLNWFNETIRAPNRDSDLTVELMSKHITGKTEYTAVNGIITINDTTIVAANITNGELLIRSEDDRNISLTLPFSTTLCPEGEFMDPHHSTCGRCNYSSYKFLQKEECRLCEENAECIGTTPLVPKTGYWHSSPFSPRMIECPLKEACEDDNRTKRLIAYYIGTVNSPVEQNGPQDHELNFNASYEDENYLQCSKAYTGIVCGTCARNYGRGADGKCVKCSATLFKSIMVTIAGIVVFLTVFTVKLMSAWRTTHDDALTHHAQVIRDKYRQAAALALAFASRRSRPTRTNIESRHPLLNSSQPGTSAAPIVTDIQSAEQTADTQDEQLGTTCREVNRSDEIRAAFASLFVIIEVYFEYTQLNSIAYELEIDWSLVMNAFLSIQGTTSRMTQFVHAHPFECNYPNSFRQGGGSTVLLISCCRALLPVFTVFIYAGGIYSWKYVSQLFNSARQNTTNGQGSEATSSSSAGTSQYTDHPFLFVFYFWFFSYVVDIVGECFRLLSYIKLPERNTNDTYDQYDKVHTTYLWAEDTGVNYMQGSHLVVAILAILCLISCVAVLVSTSVILLDGKASRRLNRKDFRQKFGFIYAGLKTTSRLSLHWLVLVSIRNIMLSFVVHIFPSMNISSNVQIGFGFIIIFTSYVLHIVFQPYEEEDMSGQLPAVAGVLIERCFGVDFCKRWRKTLESMSFHVLQSTALLLSLSIYGAAASIDNHGVSGVASEIIVTCCVLMNGAFMLFLIYRFWLALHKILDLRLLQVLKLDRVSDDKMRETEMMWLLRKAWILCEPFLERNRGAALNIENTQP